MRKRKSKGRDYDHKGERASIQFIIFSTVTHAGEGEFI